MQTLLKNSKFLQRFDEKVWESPVEVKNQMKWKGCLYKREDFNEREIFDERDPFVFHKTSN